MYKASVRDDVHACSGLEEFVSSLYRQTRMGNGVVASFVQHRNQSIKRERERERNSACEGVFMYACV